MNHYLDNTTGEPVVLVDKHDDDRIWVITMNRPHRMNALGDNMATALSEALEAYRDDKAARVAILTGAGDRAFCAGADLKQTAEIREARARGEEPKSSGIGEIRFYNMAENLGLWKPTIAAVNGFAVAGGFMIAMQCDIRIMAEHAKVGVAEVRWNMGGAGWMAPLTRQMPMGAALELCLWGDTQYTAQRCYEIGWAQRVTSSAELMPVAMAYAQRMLDMAPREVRNVKQMLYRGFNMNPMDSLTYGRWLEQNLHGMQDSIEGPKAFAEKRRPNFIDG
jgi:enoyl-CoA hydratase/carnithine racemase